MLQQLQSLQEDMLKAQDEIAEMTFEASVGGGVVTVLVDGERRVRSLTIDPDVLDPDDVEMLQDMVIAAVNQGLEQIDQATAERMSDVTGGVDIPDIGLG
ncbi:MAG TPA: YbaB/EbfC family nucleoid-associated protein [Chloroflexi bacterium]|nr:YbaB/EbfC family nucleoid-associated protein [Chloroflexota bacterium]